MSRANCIYDKIKHTNRQVEGDREPPKQKIRELCLLHPEITLSAEARSMVPPETLEQVILKRPMLFLREYDKDREQWLKIIPAELVAIARALAAGKSDDVIDNLTTQLSVAKKKKKKNKRNKRRY